ncbi:MAG TPA: hypothetical protein DEH25_05080 [Chloroflexi bacterium]|nr:hypothetical protein [Chloroflexota bacterium]HBY07209.1 hypothetical protein [Chloroflexota bacterium]
MLIIEIHVETIEETNPSTQHQRADEGPKRVNKKSTNTGNRFWNAIKLSIPGSLNQQNNTRDEQ